MSLLPSRVRVSPDPAEPAVLDLSTADEAFEALGSRTARKILATLYEEPRPPPEVRSAVGTSLQNVHYHLDRLEEAGLIEPAGTGYSEKGTEMTIYAPAREAIILFAGREHDRSRLRSMLARVVGVLAILAVGGVALDRLVAFLRPDQSVERSETLATEAADTGVSAGAGTGDVWADLAALLAEPAVAFVLGGLLVLVLAGVWWFLHR